MSTLSVIIYGNNLRETFHVALFITTGNVYHTFTFSILISANTMTDHQLIVR